MDFKIENGDLKIVNNDLVAVTSAEETAQKVSQKFKFFQGECFFAKLQGIPYFQEILKKGTSIQAVSAILKSEAMNIEGLLQLTQFSLDFDPKQRSLEIQLKGISTDGPIAVSVPLS
ncbi:MAG: hypothetical protein ISQ13_00500 [Candidatus Margulisbacteria bacterium]|nr:hypothetical protein [Candidatus Margulisiibacteriota bacterium]